MIHSGAKAVEKENIDAIASVISGNYRDSFHRTKKHLINHLKVRLAEPIVEKAIPSIVSVEMSLPKASAIFTVRLLFDEQSYVAQLYKQDVFTKIRLDLQKEPDKQWLISQIEILELDRQPVKWRDIEQAGW